jgi:hypothetical protein
MSPLQGEERRMAGRSKSVAAALMAAVTLLLFVPAAHAQMGKKGSHAAPSTETRPRVDEKAYKAALDRIATPKKPYDPWGQIHDSEPAAKSPGKSN